MKAMARQRSHGIEFKWQVAQEFIAGETLYGLSKRHDISRQLIRVWVQRYEAGALDEDAQAADPRNAMVECVSLVLSFGRIGLHSIAGIFYPSAYRGNGAGWATSIAKIGSIAGPFLAGVILSTSLPVRYIFAVLAICPAVFVMCIFVIGLIHSSMLRSEAPVRARTV
jgi:transposase